MEKRLVFECSKKEGQKPETWLYLGIGVACFFVLPSLLMKILGIAMVIIAIAQMSKKSEGRVYTTGLEIIEGGARKEIEFDKVLYMFPQLNQSMEIAYFNRPIENYTEDEIKKMLLNGEYRKILFEDTYLRDNFKYVFNTAEREFCNYVFNKYNKDIEKVEKSVYLLEQIKDDVLRVEGINTLANYVEIERFSTYKEDIQLEKNDRVEVVSKNKIYMKFGKIAQTVGEMTSYEPKWTFGMSNNKIDTGNLYNREIIRGILEKKYQIQFVNR